MLSTALAGSLVGILTVYVSLIVANVDDDVVCTSTVCVCMGVVVSASGSGVEVVLGEQGKMAICELAPQVLVMSISLAMADWIIVGSSPNTNLLTQASVLVSQPQ